MDALGPERQATLDFVASAAQLGRPRRFSEFVLPLLVVHAKSRSIELDVPRKKMVLCSSVQSRRSLSHA